MQKMDIGLVGLGVMGENLALNLARNGFGVCGFDLDAAKRDSFGQRTQGLKAQAATSLVDLVASLQTPRCVWLMVPAGAAVDAVLADYSRCCLRGTDWVAPEAFVRRLDALAGGIAGQDRAGDGARR